MGSYDVLCKRKHTSTYPKVLFGYNTLANIRKEIGGTLADDLADFCAANYRTPDLEVIREALEAHINERLQEPKMRERFDAARERRLRGEKKPLRLIPQGEKAC